MEKFLKGFDSLSRPARFTYKGQNAYKSWIGGIISFTIYVLTFFFGLIFLLNFFLKKDPRIYTHKKHLESNRVMLDSNNLFHYISFFNKTTGKIIRAVEYEKYFNINSKTIFGSGEVLGEYLYGKCDQDSQSHMISEAKGSNSSNSFCLRKMTQFNYLKQMPDGFSFTVENKESTNQVEVILEEESTENNLPPVSPSILNVDSTGGNKVNYPTFSIDPATKEQSSTNVQTNSATSQTTQIQSTNQSTQSQPSLNYQSTIQTPSSSGSQIIQNPSVTQIITSPTTTSIKIDNPSTPNGTIDTKESLFLLPTISSDIIPPKGGTSYEYDSSQEQKIEIQVTTENSSSKSVKSDSLNETIDFQKKAENPEPITQITPRSINPFPIMIVDPNQTSSDSNQEALDDPITSETNIETKYNLTNPEPISDISSIKSNPNPSLVDPLLATPETKSELSIEVTSTQEIETNAIVKDSTNTPDSYASENTPSTLLVISNNLKNGETNADNYILDSNETNIEKKSFNENSSSNGTLLDNPYIISTDNTSISSEAMSSYDSNTTNTTQIFSSNNSLETNEIFDNSTYSIENKENVTSINLSIDSQTLTSTITFIPTTTTINENDNISLPPPAKRILIHLNIDNSHQNLRKKIDDLNVRHLQESEKMEIIIPNKKLKSNIRLAQNSQIEQSSSNFKDTLKSFIPPSITTEKFNDPSGVLYYEIYFSKCINSTSQNYNCKSKMEINEFIDNTFFQINFVDNLINISNYENPVSKYINSKFFSLKSNAVHNLNLNFFSINLKTKDSLFLQSEIEKPAIAFDYHSESFLDMKNEIVQKTKFIYTNKIKIYERTYNNFADVLAKIVGIYYLFFVIGFFLNNFIEKYTNNVINENLLDILNINNNKSNEKINELNNIENILICKNLNLYNTKNQSKDSIKKNISREAKIAVFKSNTMKEQDLGNYNHVYDNINNVNHSNFSSDFNLNNQLEKDKVVEHFNKIINNKSKSAVVNLEHGESIRETKHNKTKNNIYNQNINNILQENIEVTELPEKIENIPNTNTYANILTTINAQRQQMNNSSNKNDTKDNLKQNSSIKGDLKYVRYKELIQKYNMTYMTNSIKESTYLFNDKINLLNVSNKGIINFLINSFKCKQNKKIDYISKIRNILLDEINLYILHMEVARIKKYLDSDEKLTNYSRNNNLNVNEVIKNYLIYQKLLIYK